MSARETNDAEAILGRLESQTLEFKAAAALDKPERIGREVVAMLNAEGGEVWVGVADANDRAVELEDIPDAESGSRRLLDSLLDTIEPTPEHREVEVASVAHEGGSVLRVKVSAPTPERRPFALLLRGGARLFVTRVGDRVRPMDRSQILEPANGGRDRFEAIRALREAKNAVLEQSEPVYWLRIQPERDLELDLDENVEGLLSEPERSGNLRSWHVLDPYRQPRLSYESLRTGSDPPTIIWRDGSVEVSRRLSNLEFAKKADCPPEVNGLKLLAVAVSLFRLAAALYRERSDPEGPVFADCLLVGIGGYGMSPDWEIRDIVDWPPHLLGDLDEIVFSKPFRFSSRRIVEEPDRCAARIVARIYEAFGLREDAMPHHYDRETGRLLVD